MASLERDDGVTLWYGVQGPAGDRPPLLLTHGFGASAEMWVANLPALAAGRRVIRWDLRGHGRSDAPAQLARYTHAACVADMLALLDAVQAPRAVVAGMSLGGYLSLAFHLEHPERVAALVLVDTGPGYRDPAARAGWNDWTQHMAAELEARGPDALPDSPEARAAEHVHGVGGIVNAARGLLPQHDARVIESLPKISVPTLVVVGERDTPFLGAAEAMSRRIPAAAKVVIEGGGHAPNIDRPEAFDRAVLDFLEAT